MPRTLTNARLLTFGGESHTAWHQSSWAQAIITRCLVDGTLPAPNTVCADEPVPEGS
ncbi:alpha/beta hydrolase [Actinophytocola algeriensis]|uniref:Peptidase S33 tripeptidyl aminopeptidase-like C-terminal domain-containing protein n=1 Tax=Actinophytocola algeriensis TaxID=1768010 RepID=A0A7W7VDE0_9PSEU|nr:alpha/beta hydrolase [Actinophytocola algeriensis]MBB4906072.1 hypothetical protein [Actinophytocola algeriensis]MBE1472243.1 hypothetical protein [Actinophytocola algeriensis]